MSDLLGRPAVLGHCVITAYEQDETPVERPVITFDSIDAAKRWFQNPGKGEGSPAVVSHVRMHNLGAHSQAEHGFQERGEGVTTQFDGTLLVITAPTLEKLIQHFTRMQRGG